LASLGHPCKFQRVSRLGSVTARHSSIGRQPNFAALDRGRHLYSAGRPSRWALAHISSQSLHALFLTFASNGAKRLTRNKTTHSVLTKQTIGCRGTAQRSVSLHDIASSFDVTRTLEHNEIRAYLWSPYIWNKADHYISILSFVLLSSFFLLSFFFLFLA